MSDIVECSRCGSTYRRRTEKVPFRDKDTKECEVCDAELESWNGSRIPMFTLVSRGKWPLDQQ